MRVCSFCNINLLGTADKDCCSRCLAWETETMAPPQRPATYSRSSSDHYEYSRRSQEYDREQRGGPSDRAAYLLNELRKKRALSPRPDYAYPRKLQRYEPVHKQTTPARQQKPPAKQCKPQTWQQKTPAKKHMPSTMAFTVPKGPAKPGPRPLSPVPIPPAIESSLGISHLIVDPNRRVTQPCTFCISKGLAHGARTHFSEECTQVKSDQRSNARKIRQKQEQLVNMAKADYTAATKLAEPPITIKPEPSTQTFQFDTIAPAAPTALPPSEKSSEPLEMGSEAAATEATRVLSEQQEKENTPLEIMRGRINEIYRHYKQEIKQNALKLQTSVNEMAARDKCGIITEELDANRLPFSYALSQAFNNLKTNHEDALEKLSNYPTSGLYQAESSFEVECQRVASTAKWEFMVMDAHLDSVGKPKLREWKRKQYELSHPLV